MKETDYAYAVARIRANEPGLLKTVDQEQLITAENAQAALRILSDKGWNDVDRYENVNNALRNQARKTWDLLLEIAPDPEELGFLAVKNDFHNMKAVLKEMVSVKNSLPETNLADYFLVPATLDFELLQNALLHKNFQVLPPFAGNAAQKTYEVLVRTYDGQLADIMLDAMALGAMQQKAEATGNRFVQELTELICATTNLKIVMRAIRTGKDRAFLETALCETKTLDKESMIRAAGKGMREWTDWVSTTPYSDAVGILAISATAFEKWCDDLVMQQLEGAKYQSFGIEPLVAYYFARDAEIKNVRIILSCKHNQLPVEMIRERVRKIYV